MVKICQTGLLKLNFETSPKKLIFRFLPKISAGHGWSWNFFLPISKSLGPSGVRDGWLYLKMWKKSKSLHPTVHFDRPLATLFCVHEKFSLSALAFSGYFTLHIEGGGPGFWLCDIASLVMYCNDASLRIVTKSLLHLVLYSMVLDDIETPWGPALQEVFIYIDFPMHGGLPFMK